MKLRYAPTSPFVRKVMATAVECGLAGRIEKLTTPTADPVLLQDNPLGKVPALETDAGEKLYDSPVICEYLDSLHNGPKLFPGKGQERWKALRRQALGDGINDASVNCFAEGRRPEGQKSAEFMDKQKGKIRQACRQLESEADDLGKGPVTIGHIAVGCALGYVDLRLPDLDWRKESPKLAAWHAEFSKRKCMTETAPPKQ